MGKLKKPISPKNSHVSKPICRKTVSKIYSKRLVMLQRRIGSLITERCTQNERNNELLNNLKAERILSASYRKESFDWQKKYHECMIALNTYKVKQAETMQTLSTCLEDINSIYPNMVAFSESVTSNKIRITNLFTSLHSSDANFLPRQFRDMGKVNGDSLKRNDKPMKQRVGPMVKGFLITKPKIILERLMLPQPQDQDPISADISTIGVNPQLSPIPEEEVSERDVRLRHISVRPKRRLGRAWQERKDKTENERARGRGTKAPTTRVAYDGDSSDSESNPPAIEHMEPVVRFKDVSRLLQNSSLLKMDSARTGEGESAGGSGTRQPDTEPRRSSVNPMQRSPDDPLEGSSWMFNQNNHKHLINYRHSHKNVRNSSLYKSDSSDEEDNNQREILQQNESQDLSTNSLMIKNQTFTVKTKKSSSSAETIATLSGSPKVDPDSTNDVNVQHLNNSTFRNSLEIDHSNSNPSFSSVNRSCFSSSDSSVEHNSSNKMKSEKKVSNNKNSLSVSLMKIPDDSVSPSSSSSGNPTPSKRLSSSFCGDSNPVEIPKVPGKRERKPKCHLYPGEEELPEPPKTKPLNPKKVSTVKKSHCDSKTLKVAAAKLRRKSSVANSSENGTNTNGSGDKKRKISTGGTKIKKHPFPKKSSLKKSLCSSRTSSMDGIHPLLGDENVTRPRRGKSQVCYKESPLNVKQRRP